MAIVTMKQLLETGSISDIAPALESQDGALHLH
jgi:hypothetical protein